MTGVQTCALPISSPISLQQWLKHWEDLLDNQAIAFSSRMNAVGLIDAVAAPVAQQEAVAAAVAEPVAQQGAVAAVAEPVAQQEVVAAVVEPVARQPVVAARSGV